MKNLDEENLYVSHKWLKNNSLNATFLEIFTLSCLLEADNLERRKPWVYLTNIKAKKCFSVTTH